MKKVAYLVIVLLSIGCTTTSENPKGARIFVVNPMDAFYISSDTVVLDISRSLRISDLDAQGHLLYAYDTRRNRIDVFDLKSQRYQRSVILNSEGPNGTGPVNGFSLFSNEKMLIRSYDVLNLFTLGGEKYESIGIKDMNAEDIEHKEQVLFTGNPGVADKKIESYFWLYDSLNTGKKGIVQLDFDSKNIEFFPIQGLDIFTKLDFSPLKFPPKISYADKKVVLSHANINDLLIFEIDKKKIITKDYQSALVADEKKVVKPQGADRSKIEQYMAEMMQQVFFMPPVFDASNQLHYRLSVEPTSTSEEFEMVLSIFDKDLNFLFEKALDKGALPVKYFARNSQLIILANVDDELQVQKIQITEE